MKNIIDFRALLLSFIIIISCSSTIPGQTSMSISQHTAYYSNSFYNSYQLPDLNNNLGLSLQHLIINDARQSHLYYNLNVNTFREYSNRFNHNHEFGYKDKVRAALELEHHVAIFVDLWRIALFAQIAHIHLRSFGFVHLLSP